MTITKGDVAILSLDDWRKLGGPKRDSHWVDGRSAKELARAWLGSGDGRMPVEVEAALAGNRAFGPISTWRGEPEVRQAFDSFRGEPRNADLVIEATDTFGRFIISVEGKADEPFGETVAEALSSALERYVSTSGRSKGIRRIEQLAETLFTPNDRKCAPVGSLRYQLMTATAGALHSCPADVSRTVLFIHEFVTDRTDDVRHQMNAIDLNAFVDRITCGATASVASGSVHGPIRVSGSPVGGRTVDLFIGKATSVLRMSQHFV